MTYPFSPLVALILAGLILAFARGRWLRFTGFAALAAGWLGSTPLVANLLVGSIESRAGDRAQECRDLQAIVLLTGGAMHRPASPDDMQAINSETLRRAMALIARDDPSLPLVIAGGGFYAPSEAEVLRGFVQRIAPAREVAMLETTSHNTWENATHTAALLPPPRRIALATSALHLPRARLAFETVGYTVCPWPLNRQYIDGLGWWGVLPHSTAARMTETFVHELGGWIVYGWRGAPASE